MPSGDCACVEEQSGAALPAPFVRLPYCYTAATTGVDGLTTGEVGVLALVHDEAGYGFEVIAAKLSARAARGGRVHRRRAPRRAARTGRPPPGSTGSAQDPRRASYTLPAGLDDPAVATALGRTLETAVADAYANAVAQAGPGQPGAR